MPGMFLWGLCDLHRKFLNSFQLNLLPMLAFTFTTLLHPVWLYYFVYHKGYWLEGIAMAGFVTNVTTIVALRALIQAQPRLKPAVFWPDRRVFFGLKEYLKISLPFIFLLMLDYWTWEYMTIASGFVGITAQATQVLLINMTYFACMVGGGIQSTACTLVGNEIGKGDAATAKEYLLATMAVLYFIVLGEAMVFYIFKVEIVSFITDLDTVKHECLLMYAIFLFNFLPDNSRSVLRGVVKALGLQMRVMDVHITQLIINVFANWYFPFYLKMGLWGGVDRKDYY